MDFFNFVLHSTFNPPQCQRRYEHDIPTIPAIPADSLKNNLKTLELAKRVALIALPFLSLYKPIGQSVSLVMGSSRCFTHLKAVKDSMTQKEFLACLGHAALTAFAIMALVSGFFSFQVGILVTTTLDIGISLKHAAQHLQKNEIQKALEELLQVVSSTLYLSIILTGSLEVILASTLIQGLVSVYQARSEWQQGRFPEFVAKLAMGMIRLYQAHQQVGGIRKKNTYLALEKFNRLLERVQKGRKVSHLIGTPLNEKERSVVLVDAQGNAYDFGSYIHGNGKGLVKEMNLQFRTREISGKSITELDFKVNHIFRDRLEGLVQEMNSFTSDELKEFLSLTNSHATGIKIEEIPFQFSEQLSMSLGTAYKITLEGLGSVLIGNSPDFPNLFDRVRVEIDSDKNIYECHEILSLFNLDEALQTSSQEDIERLKIGHLFRTFFPKEATKIEREEDFFSLPIDKLKEEIIKEVPSMREAFEKHLATMEASEILPGRVRYTIPGLAEEVHDLGGRALIATITGQNSNQDSFNRVASILKMGMLSSEMRYHNGMTVRGLSPSSDFMTGGADSVYTQFLTAKNFQDQMSLYNLYWGNVRILFSLDLLNAGTYQYHNDSYGSRRLDPIESVRDETNHYLNRPNILDFTREEQLGFQFGNEVMIKDRIPPSMVTGVVVANESMKGELLDCLRLQGLVSSNPGQSETIFGIPVDRFIHLGNNLSEEWLASV